MNTMTRLLLPLLGCLLMSLFSCSEEEMPEYPIAADTGRLPIAVRDFSNDPLNMRHRDTPLKILAIGNSFTHNATTYMPWFANLLSGDSVCVAKLARSSCSLEMHWQSHLEDTPDYQFYYSDGGKWVLSDLTRIDDALSVLDWDIIVIQQVSYLSGKYSSFQPTLDFLVDLFLAHNPHARIAWHSTWAYKDGASHSGFAMYGNDAERMYREIMEASALVGEILDIDIPSGTLIKRMREQYPEVEDQFSSDGHHITDSFACYALSSLWYECLVRPVTGATSLNPPAYPNGIDPELLKRADAIIKDLAPKGNDNGGNSDSVPEIRI